MKKTIFRIATVVMVLAMVVAMTGCHVSVSSSSGSASINSNVNDNKITAEFKTSEGGGTGNITLGEDEDFAVSAKVDSGKITLAFVLDDGTSEDGKVNEANTQMEVELDESAEFTLEDMGIPAGKYIVVINASDKATGSVTITTVK
mgnify:FL=1